MTHWWGGNPHSVEQPDVEQGCSPLSPAQKLRGGRLLANAQRLQSAFWQALRDLEEFVSEICEDTCELDSRADFNDLDLDSIIAGHGWDRGQYIKGGENGR